MRLSRYPTNPVAHQHSRAIFSDSSHPSKIETSRQIKFKLVGLYYSQVGPEWGTGGRLETDYLHHINFIVSGAARIIYQGEPIEYQPGHAYWTPGNTPCARECPQNLETFFLTFRCELIEGVDLFLDWPRRRPFLLGAWDRALLEEQWLSRRVSLHSLLGLQALLYRWLVEHVPDLDEIIDHHLKTFSRYQSVLDHLENHLGADLQIRDLAEIYGTTPSAFAMAFTRDVGLGPKAYLNRRLNQEACRLLVNTSLSVQKIARFLHFNDEYYFNRFFSKQNGTPPLRYRLKIRASRP